MEQALKIAQDRADKRPVHEFTLPKAVQELDDPYIKKSVGLVKLTFQEEIDAAEIAKSGGSTRAAFFRMSASLTEVDGRRVNKGDGEDEKIVNHADPIIRDLLLKAYLEISSASDSDSDSFLKSRVVKV